MKSFIVSSIIYLVAFMLFAACGSSTDYSKLRQKCGPNIAFKVALPVRFKIENSALAKEAYIEEAIEEINATLGMKAIELDATATNDRIQVSGRSYRGIAMTPYNGLAEHFTNEHLTVNTLITINPDAAADFTTTVVHEMLHALGVLHTDDPYSIMYPSNGSRSRIFIDNETAKTLNCIYTKE